MKFYLKNGKNISVPDGNQKGSGGQGKVLFKGKTAFKVYHDPKLMIPEGKILELAKLAQPNVLGPQEVLYDGKKKPIGFTMPYISDAGFLLWLFNKGYKDQEGITPEMVTHIVKRMRETFQHIHTCKCLVADPNEMNFLISKDHREPYFIDVDSYQTPSFRATAVNRSIMDRTVPFGSFTEMTDWFGFGVVAFQLYTGAHPYKGATKAYSPREIRQDLKAMDDNVSIYHKDMSMPKNALPLSVIPQNLQEWFKRVFHEKERSIPPVPGEAPTVVPTPLRTVQSTDTVILTELYKLNETIQELFWINGRLYAMTKNTVWWLAAKPMRMFNKAYPAEYKLMTGPTGPLIVKYYNGQASIHQMDGLELKSFACDKSPLYLEENVYISSNGQCACLEPRQIGNETRVFLKIVGGIGQTNGTIYDGLVVESVFNRNMVSIPTRTGSFHTCVVSLDDHRVIDAKCVTDRAYAKILGFISEKQGKYYRTIYDTSNPFDTIQEECDANERLSMAMLPNGIIAMLFSDERLELCKRINNIKILNDPPIDSSMKLYAHELDMLVVDGKRVLKVSTSK